MSDRVSRLLGEVNTILAALPGVFSSAQWGGRAYKLPGPNGTRSRPKLLAFVSPSQDGRAVGVSFKLPPPRAADIIERHDWVAPHSFRTMAPSGWVSAAISTKRHLKPLARLLAESRMLYPVTTDDAGEIETTVKPAAAGGVARRIDRIMQEAKAQGWAPPADDGFDT
jgi:hypothetical protein